MRFKTTFAVKRGLDGIVERLNTHARLFGNWAESKLTPDGKVRAAIRVTVTPSTADLMVDRVHSVGELTPANQIWTLLLGGNRKKQAQLYAQFMNWKPVLRGTESLVEADEERQRIQMNCDGTISYAFIRYGSWQGSRFDRPHVHPIIIVAMLLNAFDTAERFRTYAGAQAIEYAVDVEIEVSHPLSLLYWRDDWAEAAGSLDTGKLRLPTYSLQGRESWNDLLTLVVRDLYDAVGSSVGLGRIEIVP